MEYDGLASPSDKARFKSKWLHHITAENLRLEVGSDDWLKYFSFTFVRNPWDLVLSFYSYHKVRVEEEGYELKNPKAAERFKTKPTFREWVMAGIPIRPCSRYVKDETGNVLVNFIGRFENLQEDFLIVCNRLSLRASLPHLKSSSHDQYRGYYDGETKSLVAEHFKADLDMFRYEF